MKYNQFITIPAGEIFRVTITKYHTIECINGVWPELKFICIKHDNSHRWAIYCDFTGHTPGYIALHGVKVLTDENILSIFPCDPEILKLYNH